MDNIFYCSYCRDTFEKLGSISGVIKCPQCGMPMQRHLSNFAKEAINNRINEIQKHKQINDMYY